MTGLYILVRPHIVMLVGPKFSFRLFLSIEKQNKMSTSVSFPIFLALHCFRFPFLLVDRVTE